MALQGTLRDFGIADIFQLIAQQQKTGVLELRKDEGGLDVHFVKGLIAAAHPSGADPGQVLLDHLARSGLISADTARKAALRASEQLIQPRELLVDTGVLTNEAVAEVEHLFALEDIYDLFSWPNGEFLFVQKDIEANADSFQPISAEHVLMEGFRMVDEWPAIRRIIPDPGARVQKLSAPQPAAKKKPKKQVDPMGFDDLLDDDEEEDESGLTGEERTVLDVCQSGQSVQWVVDRSRLGSFDASKAIASLVTKGYIKLDLVSAQVERGMGFFEQQAKPRPASLILGVAAALTVAAFALFAGGVSQSAGGPARLAGALGRMRVEQGLPRLQRALSVYKLLEGSYPDSLEDLAKSQILPPDLVVSGEPPPYRYRKFGDTLGEPGYSLELTPPRP